MLADKDRTLEWLEKGWELPLWGNEAAPSAPHFDFLRDDPRFEQLLRKLGLPEEALIGSISLISFILLIL